jgi:hypothetical protein
MWWLLLIGLVAGAYIAIHIAKRHKPPTYSASAQLLVDSTERPFLRTGITQTTQPAQRGKTKVKKVPGTGATVTTTTPSQPSQSSEQQPNTNILVQAANLYPFLVTSAPVTNLRTKLYGDIQGTVTSKAMFANNGVVRFTPSQFPIIQIDSVSKTSEDAMKLANDTSLALRHWVTASQNKSRVPRSQRIVLRPLEVATTSVKTTQSRLGLAVIIGAVVLGIFYALAVGLDLLIPSRRRKQKAIESGEEDAPAVPSAEA